MKEDEVGYQLAFSKQELRKNIKEYPAKDIKKGLELLYKKVEKHLCEEENLLQVKWKALPVYGATLLKALKNLYGAYETSSFVWTSAFDFLFSRTMAFFYGF